MDYLNDNCDQLDLDLAKQQLNMMSTHISILKQSSNGTLYRDTMPISCSMEGLAGRSEVKALNEATIKVSEDVKNDYAKGNTWSKLFVNNLAKQSMELSYVPLL